MTSAAARHHPARSSAAPRTMIAESSGAHFAISCRHWSSTPAGATTRQERSSPRALRIRSAATAWMVLPSPMSSESSSRSISSSARTPSRWNGINAPGHSRCGSGPDGGARRGAASTAQSRRAKLKPPPASAPGIESDAALSRVARRSPAAGGGSATTVARPGIPVISRTRRSANASASALAARASGSNGSSRSAISSSAAPASESGPRGAAAQRIRRSNSSGPSAGADGGRTRPKGRPRLRSSNASGGISSAMPSSSVGELVEARNRASARTDSTHRPARPGSGASRRIRAKQKPNGAPKADVSNRLARMPRPPSSSTKRNHATEPGCSPAVGRRKGTGNSAPRRGPCATASIRERPRIPFPDRDFPHSPVW